MTNPRGEHIRYGHTQKEILLHLQKNIPQRGIICYACKILDHDQIVNTNTAVKHHGTRKRKIFDWNQILNITSVKGDNGFDKEYLLANFLHMIQTNRKIEFIQFWTGKYFSAHTTTKKTFGHVTFDWSTPEGVFRGGPARIWSKSNFAHITPNRVQLWKAWFEKGPDYTYIKN